MPSLPKNVSLRRTKKGDQQVTVVDPYAPTPVDASATHVGVEVDGKVCRSVTVRGGEVLAWQSVAVDGELGPREALVQWAKSAKTSGAKVRVVWSGPGQRIVTTRHRDVPQTASLQKALISDLADEHMPDAPSVAGRIYPPDGHSDGQLIVLAGVGRDQLETVWESVGTNDWEVVPSVLLTQIDGIHLFMQESVVRIVGVQNGQLHTCVELADAGGLGFLRASIENAQDNSAASAAVLKGYVTGVVTGVTKWVDSWVNSSQLDAPDRLWIHGPGARIPNLANSLMDSLNLSFYYHGNTELMFAPLDVADRTGISDQDIPAAWMPVVAATSGINETCVLDNPVAIRAAILARKRREHAFNVSILVVGMMLVVVMLVVPLLLGSRDRNAAHQNLITTEKTKSGLHQQYNIYNVVTQGAQAMQQVTSSQADFSQLWPLIQKSTPAGGTVQSIQVTTQNNVMSVTMNVTIASSGQNPQSAVGKWLTNLTNVGFQKADTSAFQYDKTSGNITSTYTFTYTTTPPKTNSTIPNGGAGSVKIPLPGLGG